MRDKVFFEGTEHWNGGAKLRMIWFQIPGIGTEFCVQRKLEETEEVLTSDEGEWRTLSFNDPLGIKFVDNFIRSVMDQNLLNQTVQCSHWGP